MPSKNQENCFRFHSQTHLYSYITHSMDWKCPLQVSLGYPGGHWVPSTSVQGAPRLSPKIPGNDVRPLPKLFHPGSVLGGAIDVLPLSESSVVEKNCPSVLKKVLWRRRGYARYIRAQRASRYLFSKTFPLFLLLQVESESNSH